MAPGRTSNRRAQAEEISVTHPPAVQSENDVELIDELFTDPMLGIPLAMYIEKDVEDRDVLLELITKHGGVVSPGYSGVPYILVDPLKISGQNLYRQYAGKKGKVVLNSRWVHECIKAGALQTFHQDYAGCKITGTEMTDNPDRQPATSATNSSVPPGSVDNHQPAAAEQPPPPAPVPVPTQPPPTLHPHPGPIPPLPPGIPALIHPPPGFPYPVYVHAPPPRGPPQTWQATNGIAPQQTHLNPPPPPPPHLLHRPPWEGYEEPPHPGDPLDGTATPYDYRYRDDQTGWVPHPHEYYPPYDHPYHGPPPYIGDPSSSAPPPPPPPPAPSEPAPTRGRRRIRTQTQAPSASSLVVSSHNPPARSPTPPSRVIKSTYGGNLFTADDVMYLKKYIDYCQEQGLVLSLREICERIAVKAPHHTFYSWRRYCNKHQIRLGGYPMNPDRPQSPQQGDNQEGEDEEEVIQAPNPAVVAAAHQSAQADSQRRNRSPTPPRALFRSTTGKGVAFTEEDVTFLVKFMEYRKAQGRLDMVAFWKDVATKAPHHSRASWMKYWRRHKHELNRSEGDEPLPQPPEKKMRYSKEDDILLAKYLVTKPEGTSDRIFQAFGRIQSHHPWKGWQEHHRIHKAKIDHLIKQLQNGENIDEEPTMI